MYKDLKGSKCSHCQQGTYTHSNADVADDKLHCSYCGREIQRWQSPVTKRWETYPGEDPFGSTDFDDRYDR